MDLYFGALPAPGTDRDGNGLSDAWELKHFNTLGHDPHADLDGDGLKLMLENAFNLSPLVPDANSRQLPRAVVPGTNSAAALGYRVPLALLNEFRFTPEISSDLQTWFDSSGYFLIHTFDTGSEREFIVERGASWPANENAVFLRLRIDRITG